MFRNLAWRRVFAVALAGAVISGVAVPTGHASPAEPLPVPVTAGGLPTPQTDGIVFSVVIVGDTAYAGGRFQKARPAGVAPGGPGEVARTNLLAFDVTTGDLLPWAPRVSNPDTLPNRPGNTCRQLESGEWTCDTVFRLETSPDGRHLYVGGDFAKINDQWHSRLARFDTTTGQLDTDFTPTVAGRVRGIAVTDDTVYLGGAFTRVNTTPRQRLAALATTGTVTDWAPTVDGDVHALAAAPGHDRVLLGGSFDTVNGATHHAMMAVHASTGANAPWNASVPAGTEVVTDIAIDDTGTAYYGAYDHGGQAIKFEGRAAIDIPTGTPRWWDGCYGDTQALATAGGVLYSASHTHDCTASNAAIPPPGRERYYRLLAETTTATNTATVSANHVTAGDPIPTVLPWFPTINAGPPDSAWQHGPWAIDATTDWVVAGGEFTTVNGQPQQSLTRFAARHVPGAKNYGPQFPFRAPQLTRNPDGHVVITWQATWSGQTSDIRYEIIRQSTPQPIHTLTRSSRPWDLPHLTYTDHAHTAGTYRIRAIDTDGTRISSPSTTIE